MDSTIDEEEFTSFDQCTSMTGTYLDHDSYSHDYICNVYHNEHMNCSGFDLNTAVIPISRRGESVSPGYYCWIKKKMTFLAGRRKRR